ncbi:thymidine phosphorylase [bacterium]|nr:thymidine phosphorylase [bacterium]
MKKNNFQLSAKVIDIEARVAWIVLIHQEDCQKLGIRPGDGLVIHLKGQSIGCYVDVTDTLVKRGEIGIFEDLAQRFSIEPGEVLEISLLGKPKSLEAIQKKLNGKELNYKEIYEIVSDIVSRKLNDVAVAFFVASSFFEKISPRELFYLTKAMAETGTRIKFSGIVADKHSVGGLAGNETTPIIVPIVASYGIFIPKTCSRAITSASGTADTFETIAPVSFETKKLKNIVNKTKGCIVWSAGDIVPSDARIIEVASQLMIESFPKMVSSIMAKKVALGIKNLVVDVPVNPFAKVKSINRAEELKKIFEDIAKRFKIKIKVSINKAREPIGRGIGPALQIRDDLKVLEQRKDKPLDLEKRALELAGYILELSGKAKTGKGYDMARDSLYSGRALKKFQEIVAAQGGKKNISSEDIRLSDKKYDVKSPKSGRIKLIHNKNLIEICRILGAPYIKEAGIYLHKKTGEKVKRGEALFTLYAGSPLRLELALKALKKKNPYLIQ